LLEAETIEEKEWWLQKLWYVLGAAHAASVDTNATARAGTASGMVVDDGDGDGNKSGTDPGDEVEVEDAIGHLASTMAARATAAVVGNDVPAVPPAQSPPTTATCTTTTIEPAPRPHTGHNSEAVGSAELTSLLGTAAATIAGTDTKLATMAAAIPGNVCVRP
jgi:hypothetical protein